MFDSSVMRGSPISFPLNGVIKGWTEGLQLMKVGIQADWLTVLPSRSMAMPAHISRSFTPKTEVRTRRNNFGRLFCGPMVNMSYKKR